MTTLLLIWAAGIFGFVAGAAWVGMMRGDPPPGDREQQDPAEPLNPWLALPRDDNDCVVIRLDSFNHVDCGGADMTKPLRGKHITIRDLASN